MSHSRPSVPLGRWLSSLLWTVLFQLSTVIWAVPCLLIGPLLPYVPRYRLLTLWGRFNVATLGWLCGLRFRVVGLEHLPDRAAIVIANHQSTWETLAFQQLFPPHVYVLKKELMRVPFFGWALSLIGPIAIDRAEARRAMQQLVTAGRERLAKGRWIVLFPEGTRVAPGAYRPYKPGGAMLASATGAPIVPVAHNAGCFWPRKGLLKKPGEIHVSIGEAIDPAGKTAAEVNAEVEDWLRPEVARLVDLAQ